MPLLDLSKATGYPSIEAAILAAGEDYRVVELPNKASDIAWATVEDSAGEPARLEFIEYQRRWYASGGSKCVRH